jgi:hypothetical protein
MATKLKIKRESAESPGTAGILRIHGCTDKESAQIAEDLLGRRRKILA